MIMVHRLHPAGLGYLFVVPACAGLTYKTSSCGTRWQAGVLGVYLLAACTFVVSGGSMLAARRLVGLWIFGLRLRDEVMLVITNQVGTAHPDQCLAQQWPVGRIMVAQ